MKKIYLLCGFLAILFFSGCYKDLGNYDYHAINELEIDSLLSTYSVDRYDSLSITPVLRGTLYSDTSRFTYTWEIGSSSFSGHNLRIQVDMTPGYKYSRYIVTDKETNVKKYHEFGVNVSSSTAGDLIMVLSKYQGRAELSYLRLDKPADWTTNYFQDRFGQSLGSTPQQLAICYTKSARNAPFVNSYGRVMVLVDNIVNLIDKSSLIQDTINPILTVDAYLQLIAYPKPEIEAYRSEFVNEGISLWRRVTYGDQMSNHFMEISAGRLFSAASLAPSIWTTTYYYNISSPYRNGYLTPFGFWDDMSDTPHDNNLQAGYSLGNFIVYDQNNYRFAKAGTYGSMASIEEADVKAFPGYDLLWGAATNRPNNTCIAVLSNGNQCRLVLLQDGTSSVNKKATKILTGEIGGGNVINAQSKFYMMKYNESLFFSKDNAIYRYNIMNIASGIAPAERDKVFDLTQFGYDANAVITAICVSRTEKTMLVGVSRYGDDTEAQGEEAKGDVLYFDLNSGTGVLTYNEEKSEKNKGVSGIPVEIQIKYQEHYRNGVDVYGELRDNI